MAKIDQNLILRMIFSTGYADLPGILTYENGTRLRRVSSVFFSRTLT